MFHENTEKLQSQEETHKNELFYTFISVDCGEKSMETCK